jgi:hypothetical protein
MFRLAHYAEDTPGLWAAPVVLLVLMFLAAFVVARKTSAPQRVIGNLAVWVGLLLVTLPLMSRLASMHVGISMDSEDYRASYYGGPVGWQATLLLGLVGLVCAAVVALVSGAVDRTQLRAQAGRLQANPGRPAQPTPAPWPPGQQPSGPPPGWQPGWQQPPAPQSADPWPHTPVPSHQPSPPATTDPDEGRTRIRPPTQ